MTTPKSTPGEETLKAWVHWVLINPLDEDQRMHAEATRALFERIAELEFRIQMMLDDGECEMYRRQAAESIGYRASPYDKPPEVKERVSLLDQLSAADRQYGLLKRLTDERASELEQEVREACKSWEEAQAREQRLIEAFEGLVEKFRKAEANCRHGSITYKQAAEWAQAALVEAKGEKEC